MIQPKTNINALLAEYSKELGEDLDDVDSKINEENVFEDDPELRKLQQQLQEFIIFLKYRYRLSKQQNRKCYIIKKRL